MLHFLSLYFFNFEHGKTSEIFFCKIFHFLIFAISIYVVSFLGEKTVSQCHFPDSDTPTQIKKVKVGEFLCFAYWLETYCKQYLGSALSGLNMFIKLGKVTYQAIQRLWRRRKVFRRSTFRRWRRRRRRSSSAGRAGKAELIFRPRFGASCRRPSTENQNEANRGGCFFPHPGHHSLN